MVLKLGRQFPPLIYGLCSSAAPLEIASAGSHIFAKGVAKLLDDISRPVHTVTSFSLMEVRLGASKVVEIGQNVPLHGAYKLYL
jgi:hypothetical protein